ncbi:MAG: hypothetical protein ABFS45_06620 [Pseudomonadota bacterium]
MHTISTSRNLLIIAALLVSGTTHAAPVISTIEGNITPDGSITIRGSGFTQKPNASPLFWWHADDTQSGNAPSSLGRKSAWDSTYFNGEVSTAVVAPGSQQAVRWDLGMAEAPALAEIVFGSNNKQLFVHRKFYEDFNVVEDVAIRTRVTGLPSCPADGDPGVLSPGDPITGVDSGATGVVSRFFQEGAHCAIYYDNQTGTINNDPPADFVFGEKMLGPGGLTMTNNEGSAQYPTGTSRSFNNKIIRFRSATNNNVYTGQQGLHGSHMGILREYTGIPVNLENKYLKNPLFQIPFQWVTDEIVYKSSSAPGVADGLWNYYQNGVLASDETYISIDADNPEPYDSVFQHQVSNGAQPGSYVYYDSIYLDDSWHRVVICNESTWAACKRPEIQIPKSWNDNEIIVQLNMGELEGHASIYLYVFDENGVPNSDGHSLCPMCPLPPTPQ